MDAIHPGYGFLAENAEFAEICQRSDIVFIGPTAAQIRRMGDKAVARRTMQEVGVPTVPGSPGANDNATGVAAMLEVARILKDEKLPRTIRLDGSDAVVFAQAAEPGEWAVAGTFLFAGRPADSLSRKEQIGFRTGFLGIESFGHSTLVVVSEASEEERAVAVAALAVIVGDRWLGDVRAKVANTARFDHQLGITLIVAGDVDGDEAERMAFTAFDDWRGDAAPTVLASYRAARRSRAMHIVAKPDARQSELRLGSVFLPRKHPDYHAALVMNAVLGGLFSSRINLNLREKHGYTYGAFSHLDWRRQSGPFVVSTAVQSEVTAPAAREAIAEIERMRVETITEDELSLATSYLGGVFPIRYETTDAIAGALATLVRYDLPDDSYDTYRDHVRAVTTDDVLRVARQHLDANAMQMVVVGELESVQTPLEQLGFGPTTVYDTEGEVL
mgnify:CR=1 FL=1